MQYYTIPEAIVPVVNLGIYLSALLVFSLVVWGNLLAIARLKRETKIYTVHYTPMILAVVLAVTSLLFSFTGIYEKNLDSLFSPVGIGILAPIFFIIIYCVKSHSLRDLLRYIPLYQLVIPQVTRLSGYVIILLVTHRVLAPHVGNAVGYGDIAAALSAILVIFFIVKRLPGWRGLTYIWNTFGILDFVVAAGLTFLTLPTPAQVFFTVPDSSVLATLPVGIAPTLFVPLLYLMHFSVYIKLRQIRANESNTLSKQS